TPGNGRSPLTRTRRCLLTMFPILISSIRVARTREAPPKPLTHSNVLRVSRPRRCAAELVMRLRYAPVSTSTPTFLPSISPSTIGKPPRRRTGHSAIRTNLHLAGSAANAEPASTRASARTIDLTRQNLPRKMKKGSGDSGAFVSCPRNCRPVLPVGVRGLAAGGGAGGRGRGIRRAGGGLAAARGAHARSARNRRVGARAWRRRGGRGRIVGQARGAIRGRARHGRRR